MEINNPTTKGACSECYTDKNYVLTSPEKRCVYCPTAITNCVECRAITGTTSDSN